MPQVQTLKTQCQMHPYWQYQFADAEEEQQQGQIEQQQLEQQQGQIEQGQLEQQQKQLEQQQRQIEQLQEQQQEQFEQQQKQLEQQQERIEQQQEQFEQQQKQLEQQQVQLEQFEQQQERIEQQQERIEQLEQQQEQFEQQQERIEQQQGQINDLHTGVVDLINYVNKNIEPLLQQQPWLHQKEDTPSVDDQFKLAADILPKFVRYNYNITPTSHIEGTITKGTFPETDAARFNKDALLFLKREQPQIKNLSSNHIYKIMYKDLQVRTQGRSGSKIFYQGLMFKQQQQAPDTPGCETQSLRTQAGSNS